MSSSEGKPRRRGRPQTKNLVRLVKVLTRDPKRGAWEREHWTLFRGILASIKRASYHSYRTYARLFGDYKKFHGYMRRVLKCSVHGMFDIEENVVFTIDIKHSVPRIRLKFSCGCWQDHPIRCPTCKWHFVNDGDYVKCPNDCWEPVKLGDMIRAARDLEEFWNPI